MSKAGRDAREAVAIVITALDRHKLPHRVINGAKHLRVQTQRPGQGWENVTSISCTPRFGSEAPAFFAQRNVKAYLNRHGYRG